MFCRRSTVTTAPLPAPSNPVQIPVTGDARVSEVLGETSVKESTSSSTFARALPAQPIANAERVEIGRNP